MDIFSLASSQEFIEFSVSPRRGRAGQRPRVSLASQSQRGRVLLGLESQVGDARVLAGVLGGGGGGHDGGGGGGLGGERRQRKPERRRREHHVGRMRRQVRVQVVLSVGHGAVQLELRLHLKGEGRHVAMTILRDGTHGWGEKGENMR